MKAKIEKADHIVMFAATGEFYAHEVPGEMPIGFFACPSCGVKVYHKKRITSFPVNTSVRVRTLKNNLKEM